jgi:hypothetical protein
MVWSGGDRQGAAVPQHGIPEGAAMMRLLSGFRPTDLEGTGIEDQVGKDEMWTPCSSGSREIRAVVPVSLWPFV